MTIPDTRDPDTDVWLTELRLDSPLEHQHEPGSETLRGTAGRGQLSVEARRTVSTLDDSSDTAFTLLPVVAPAWPPAAGNEPAPNAVRLAAIGGTGTMSLGTFEQRPDAAGNPSSSSMRFMETSLAFIAILVALLLNLGR